MSTNGLGQSRFGQDFDQIVRRHVLPDGRDLLEARSLILDVLSERGTSFEREMLQAWLERRGLAAGDRPGAVEIRKDASGAWVPPERDDPQLQRIRMGAAIREGLADLFHRGVLTRVTGTVYGEEPLRVSVRYTDGSTSGSDSVQYFYPLPTWNTDPSHGRWRLLAPSRHPREVIAAVELAESLKELLTSRGSRCLSEAGTSYRMGSFLAASQLLGAASEAAWFTIGRTASGRDAKLDRLVESGQSAAEVINRSGEILKRENLLHPMVVNEVLSHAAYLRDLRNCAVHPVDPVRDGPEEALSEAGCAVMFLSSRLYFERLNQALQALKAKHASTEGSSTRN